MRDSRLKTKQVDTSHTGGNVQPRAPLVYCLYGLTCLSYGEPGGGGGGGRTYKSLINLIIFFAFYRRP